MTVEPRVRLDEVDAVIVQALQNDGRLSIADLARTISMSASSTADRLRRLVDAGILCGYRAIVDPAAVGYPLCAFVRIRLSPGTGSTFSQLLRETPQVLEAHHLTGEECFLLKVVAKSMHDLEALTARFVTFGHVTTNLVFSSPVTSRPVPTD